MSMRLSVGMACSEERAFSYGPLSDVVVDKWLGEKYPERFAAVRAEFAQKETDLDQQIAALSVKTAA
jgi:hypothetical protein